VLASTGRRPPTLFAYKLLALSDGSFSYSHTAPRLLVAFGAQRERDASAEALHKYAGSAPVTERRGKKAWGHWRLQGPTFLRHTFVEGAAASTRHAFGAQVSYQQQRDKGKAPQAAVRALAFTWMRSLSRCWQRLARHTMKPCIFKRSNAVVHHSCTTWRIEPAKA
jgi:hypothetical protein